MGGGIGQRAAFFPESGNRGLIPSHFGNDPRLTDMRDLAVWRLKIRFALPQSIDFCGKCNIWLSNMKPEALPVGSVFFRDDFRGTAVEERERTRASCGRKSTATS